MANTTELYNEWLEKAVKDPDLKTELENVKGKDEEINDRFYRDLEFGTGGLRGVIGAGTNRMNVYTVGKATQGLANYLKNTGKSDLKVAVAYDSRIKSDVFAKHAASIFAANGITANIYTELMPTPMLSWAVRALGCDAGIIVTASHNPAKYNGYKVYGSDGCQVTLEAAEKILGEIEKLNIFADVKSGDFEQFVNEGRIKYIGQDVIDEYIANVKKQSIHPELCAKSGLKVVYTPLNGAGNKPVRRILKEIGINNVVVVKEQEMPDGNFTTCPYPNPEIKEALHLGLELCKTEKPDLLLATDPDSDRVGIAVPDGDNYVLFTGNEVGAMLLEYICKERIAAGTMPANPVAVKTIVTTDLVKAIAAKYGVELREVLTGFKFIGEQIKFFEQNNSYNFVMGMEESYGCLVGTYARDKDAPVAVMCLCEAAAYCKSQGITLWDHMLDLYEKYGYYKEGLYTITLKGVTGAEKIRKIMSSLRAESLTQIDTLKVLKVRDYEKNTITDLATGEVTESGLPQSNVLYYDLEDGAWACVRPSGTEPKIKLYYGIKGTSLDDADAKLEALQTALVEKLNKLAE